MSRAAAFVLSEPDEEGSLLGEEHDGPYLPPETTSSSGYSTTSGTSTPFFPSHTAPSSSSSSSSSSTLTSINSSTTTTKKGSRRTRRAPSYTRRPDYNREFGLHGGDLYQLLSDGTTRVFTRYQDDDEDDEGQKGTKTSTRRRRERRRRRRKADGEEEDDEQNQDDDDDDDEYTEAKSRNHHQRDESRGGDRSLFSFSYFNGASKRDTEDDDDDNDDDDDGEEEGRESESEGYSYFDSEGFDFPDQDEDDADSGCDCCACCPQIFCKLDAWCGLQSARTRVCIAIFACILLSFLVFGIALVPTTVIRKSHEVLIENTCISGGGSAAMSAIGSAFQKAFLPNCVNITSSDSIFGFLNLLNSSYQFAFTDTIPPQLTREATKTAFYPMMTTTLNIVAHLPVETHSFAPLNLSRELLVGIFNGNISNWTHPLIVEANPGFDFLPYPISPLHFDNPASGANLLFWELLCSFSNSNSQQKWDDCPVGLQWLAPSFWPVPNPGFLNPILTNGDMSTDIKGLLGSIGFLAADSASTLLTSEGDLLTAAALQNQAGQYVMLTNASRAASVNGGKLVQSQPHSFTCNITDLPNCVDCWPLTSFGYVSILFQDVAFNLSNYSDFKGSPPPAKAISSHLYHTEGEALGRFFYWYYHGCHDHEVRPFLTADLEQCTTPRDSRIILNEINNVIPSHILYLSTSTFRLSLWAISFVLVFVVITLFFIWRWTLWSKLRIIRRKEKEQLQAYAALEKAELVDQETRRTQLLHEVGITSNGERVTLLKPLGRGSLATVYFAEWCGAAVAVKKLAQLPRDQAQQQASLFLEETTIMSKLRHPNIVQLLAACMDPEYMLVIEFCARGPLVDVVHQARQGQLHLSLLRRLKMALDMARGLMYLHTRKPPVIHRDLKPQNILVTEDLVCKISDFGMALREEKISRQLDRVSSIFQNASTLESFDVDEQFGSLVTTVPYLPREVLLYSQWSAKSDIYSLSLCIWELFSNQEMYHGLKATEILSGVLNSELRPPVTNLILKDLQPLFPSWWRTDANLRPSAEQLFQALRSMVDHLENEIFE